MSEPTAPAARCSAAPTTGSGAPPDDAPAAAPGELTALVISVSDRAFRGIYADRGGPLAAELLARHDIATIDIVLVPDEPDLISAAIAAGIAAGHNLVLTTGGTGVGPRDVTPEATAPLLERQVPGIAEAIRVTSLPRVPTAALSRGLAGVSGSTLVVNLPGSTGGVKDGIAVVGPLVGHVAAMIRGESH